MEDKLKELQTCLLSILKDVKVFLDKYDIKYCVMYGSAIGAVRHNGFIPWDDDLDIAINQEDMDKFVDLWEKYGDNEKYYLKKIDHDSHINHMKVILRKSPFIVEYEDSEETNGLFLDVFPLYKVKKNKVKTVQRWNIIRIIYTRRFASKRYGKFNYFASWCMLNLVPKCIQEKLYYTACKHVEKYKDEPMDECYRIDLANINAKKVYPYDVLSEVEPIKFEDTMVYISSKTDEMLTALYGDYMKLPPVEERINKHDIIERE